MHLVVSIRPYALRKGVPKWQNLNTGKHDILAIGKYSELVALWQIVIIS